MAEKILRKELPPPPELNGYSSYTLDVIVWYILISILELRLFETLDVSFIGKPLCDTLYKLKYSNNYKTICSENNTYWHELWQFRNHWLASLQFPIQLSYALLDPFVKHGAGPRLARYFPFAYELCIARRLVVGDDGSVTLEKIQTKREHGVYYSPPDVVQHIVNKTLGRFLDPLISELEHLVKKNSGDFSERKIIQIVSDVAKIKILDPAVGGGEFLIECSKVLSKFYDYAKHSLSLHQEGADFKELKDNDFFTYDILSRPLSSALFNNLYGLDLDPCAVRLCILSLSSQAAHENTNLCDTIDKVSKNIRQTDSIISASYKLNHKNELKETTSTQFFKNDIPKIEEIYPDIFTLDKDGFNIIIGNPPYCRLSETERQFAEELGYSVSLSKDIYALFIEAAVQLVCNQNSSIGFIVPLSLSFSENLAPTRKLLINLDRDIWLSHYDNIPGTIFSTGKPESANTNLANSQRTTILIINDISEASRRIMSTHFQRWRSKERPNLFKNQTWSDITSAVSVKHGFPKIGSNKLVEFYHIFIDNGVRLNKQLDKNGNYLISIPSTARYFLSALPNKHGRSGSSINLSFHSEEIAIAILAALNSNIFYWFWRTYGDGFHVTKKLILEFPIPKKWLDNLKPAVSLGNDLISHIGACGVSKRNAGKSVDNVNFNSQMELLILIDRLYLKSMGIDYKNCPDFSVFKSSSTITWK